jgi:hypothetical protein
MATMVRVVLHTADAIPANYIQNQFCLGHPDGDGHVVADVVTAIKDFYDGIRSSVLTSDLAQNGHEMKFYALPGIQPNYPFAEETWDFDSSPSGAGLPREVAVALSFQGSRAAGFPQARRRGRIFIGPVLATANSSGRPSSTIMSNLAFYADALRVALNPDPQHYWAVWSTVDQEAVEVQNGWVDNAFDTQRRRGVATTSRTVWPTP